MADRMISLSDVREVLAQLMHGREYLAGVPPGLRLTHFTDAISGLPDPAPEPAAIDAVLGVFRERGYRFLGRELAGVWESRWPSALIPDKSPEEDARPWMPKCQWCSQPCRDKRARYCSPSHRQAAYKRRKREG